MSVIGLPPRRSPRALRKAKSERIVDVSSVCTTCWMTWCALESTSPVRCHPMASEVEVVLFENAIDSDRALIVIGHIHELPKHGIAARQRCSVRNLFTVLGGEYRQLGACSHEHGVG